MQTHTLGLTQWWNSLSSTWQSIFIENLGLEDCFSLNDVEYVFTIESLNCAGKPIKDLSPLYYLTQLESLNLNRTQVRDFSPLRALPNLRELSAIFSLKGDIGVLVGLNQLEVLDISYPLQPIQNLGDLKHLQCLREFYCNSCGLRETYPFAEMDQLEVICGYFNQFATSDIARLRVAKPECEVLV